MREVRRWIMAVKALRYITGGGGCLVKNFGKVSADRVKFVDDICAAAKGYEYLAELQLGGKG